MHGLRLLHEAAHLQHIVHFRKALAKGPDENGLSLVSDVAQQRIREPKDKLYEKRPYRPRTLRAVIKKYGPEWGLK